MTEQEAYLFDLRGYMVVENALSASQVAALNAIVDEQIDENELQAVSTHRFGDILNWGQPYKELIDNPTVLPYMEGLLGPELRLDHVYLDLIRSGLSPIGANLHGGGTPFNPTSYFQYKNGGMHCGLTVAAYNLRDVGPEDGGFACVPGSHKSNYLFPGEWRDLSEEVQPFVSRITGAAGTAIIFTEALTHGPLPWTGAGERRTIFYKYSPKSISWSAGYPEAGMYGEMSERQAEILEAPNNRYSGRQRVVDISHTGGTR